MDRTDPIFHSLAIIEETIRERLTVAHLADSIHVSKYHYQRLFREVVGDSVMRYVTRRRLTLAAGELSETGASILDIALRYGFDSHEGFSRSFKAYLGMTPSEYRKRHAHISPTTKKEAPAMPHTPYTSSMIQELSQLISQARETAAYLRHTEDLNAAKAYAPFWDLTANRIDATADDLSSVLDQMTSVGRQPNGLSARFTLLRAMEGAAFRCRITAFQAGLMVSRAVPEYRDTFRPACERCSVLAQSAQLNADRLSDLFRELSALIFRDMREEASRLLLAAAEAGRAAAMPLAPVPYYAYIADGLRTITGTLSSTPLEKITISLLEEQLFQLDAISLAAEADVLRTPDHRPLFHGLIAFRTRIVDTVTFFEDLSADFTQAASGQDVLSPQARSGAPASWESILLFHLKGEIQKLEKLLSASQKISLEAICGQLDTAIQPQGPTEAGEAAGTNAGLFLNVSDKLFAEAGQLGPYGGPLLFIAGEIKGSAP